MSNQNSCFDNFKRFIRFVKDSWLKVRFQGIIKEVARLNFSTANQKKTKLPKACESGAFISLLMHPIVHPEYIVI